MMDLSHVLLTRRFFSFAYLTKLSHLALPLFVSHMISISLHSSNVKEKKERKKVQIV